MQIPHDDAGIAFKFNNFIQVTFYHQCRNPSLGLMTKARGCKVAGQEKDPRVTSYAPRSAKKCEGMNPHTPK